MLEQTLETGVGDLIGQQTLDRLSSNALAGMRFDLGWQSAIARHTDSFASARINMWRDIFPPELEAQLMGMPVGHCVRHDFPPGGLLTPWREDRLRSIPGKQFNRNFTRRGTVQPRTGRFYPAGILQGMGSIFQTDLHPVRLAGVGNDRLLVDLNHPLADKTLSFEVRIEEIRAIGDEHGGRCNEIGVLVTENGPGMQARWRDTPTDFWSELPFGRKDPRPDSAFYDEPRFVDHIDSTAIAEISGLYGRLIKPGARILDLMSSWHSHLPETLFSAEVTGLGMNQAELDANPMLNERLIHDLNMTPTLPFANTSFDAIICTVSVEYLIDPFAVFREAARVLRPGGRFIVTFSNRWFPPKVIQLWKGIHEFERAGLVLEYFLESGLYRNLETWSMRGLPRPREDKYADRLLLSDPVHAVWGEKA